MESQESSAADYRLSALCGSDLNLEATRAVLLSLSPETKLRELSAEVSCWMEHMLSLLTRCVCSMAAVVSLSSTSLLRGVRWRRRSS